MAPAALPTSAPNGVASVNEPGQPTTTNFQNVLLTFIFPDDSRRTLRALSSLSFASRAELYYLTEAHLEATIPDLERLQLVVTPYQEVPMEGQIAVTEMLQGSLTLSNNQADVPTLLMAAFSGNNMSTYLERLRDADDAKLQKVLDTSYGIPLGIENTGNLNGGRTTSNIEEDDGDMNGLLIGILVCGAAGVLGLLVVGFVMLSRYSTVFRRTLGLKTTTTNSFSQGSPTSMEPQLIRRMQSVDMVDSPNGQGQEMRLDDDELPEGARGEDVTFGDVQSEITSVYSYVDRTGLNESIMTDDQSYSIAPSFLMRKSHTHQGDDDDMDGPGEGENNSSNMWSVMDGLGDQSLAHKSPNNNNITHKSAGENSPSRLVISATRPATDDNDTYIFNDDVSLVSETSEKLNSRIMRAPMVDSRPASPIANNESFRSSMESNIKSVTTRSLSLESASIKKDGAEERPNFTTVLRPKGAAKPQADLSHLMEASETSRSSSRVSAEGRVSAPSSVSKNRSPRSPTVDSVSKEESTDDDSSLFMGPDSYPKENLPDNSKILSLGEGNKVSPAEDKNTYRIAPLFRTTGRLSDKDKGQLGVRRVPSKDDTSLAESMTYPDAYAVASFRDDMSISTNGSRPRKAYFGMKASF
eukprot:scaffold7850_cov171-Amphora_coffeaeformis.AAC.3